MLKIQCKYLKLKFNNGVLNRKLLINPKEFRMHPKNMTSPFSLCWIMDRYVYYMSILLHPASLYKFASLFLMGMKDQLILVMLSLVIVIVVARLVRFPQPSVHVERTREVKFSVQEVARIVPFYNGKQ